ncbi:ead/Ea22-like family protein [Salmonella enterica]|nr:ead/Ea22-like family protein [Salmonella enterica]EAU9596165.1 ead/Ea22-like family protein [Salmonella enterica]
MSNIDKQALREAAVAIETVATPQKLLAFRVKVTPQVVLALLDENLQLQREKDAIEAVALALRDDMRDAREKLEAAERRIAETDQRNAELTARIEPMDRRIAELEAREVTLPAEKFCPSEYAGSQYWEETEVWNKAISACAVAVRATGIKVKG